MTEDYTPALGRRELTGLYDLAIAGLTREAIWRRATLKALSPQPHETIVDLGAGTGSLALMVKRASPEAHVVAADPDPAVREIAERKARHQGLQITFETAMGDAELETVKPGQADAVVCTLVLHQCPDPMKRAILANVSRLLRPGGRLILTDYGRPSGPFTALGFLMVRFLDGFESTRLNMRGGLPGLIEAAGLGAAENLAAIRTPTGRIQVWRAWRPMT